MKKILFLLLLISSISYGQAIAPTRVKITNNVISTSAPFINAQETDGFVNKINKADLIEYLEFASAVNLPVTGVVGKLYLIKDNNLLYRWNGTVYTTITADVSGKENTANKQNSLVVDGAGVKFPTVDAVNAEVIKTTGDQTKTGRLKLGNGTFSTDDSSLLINRVLSGNGGTTGFHAIRDESIYNGSGTGLLSYASFDAIPNYIGASNYGHLHGFQARLTFNGSGSIGVVRSHTSQTTNNGTGAILENIGYNVSDAIGTGEVRNNIGLYIENLTKGSISNFAIYSAGATASYHQGKWETGGEIKAGGKLSGSNFKDSEGANSIVLGVTPAIAANHNRLAILGYGAGFTLSNSVPTDYNTYLGAWAGAVNLSGSNNTSVGAYAGYNQVGSGNVNLGKEAGYFETGSNKLFIDNDKRVNEADARVKSLIYGQFDANPINQFLNVNGNLNINGNLISPTLTGVPTAPTATAGSNGLQIANKEYVLANGSRPYKSYVAIINQSSTGAPTITTLENTLGATIIPTRISAGSYLLTYSATVAGNGYATINGDRSASGQTPPTRYGISVGNTSITISSSIFNSGLSLFESVDGILSSAYIEVRIY